MGTIQNSINSALGTAGTLGKISEGVNAQKDAADVAKKNYEANKATAEANVQKAEAAYKQSTNDINYNAFTKDPNAYIANKEKLKQNQDIIYKDTKTEKDKWDSVNKEQADIELSKAKKLAGEKVTDLGRQFAEVDERLQRGNFKNKTEKARLTKQQKALRFDLDKAQEELMSANKQMAARKQLQFDKNIAIARLEALKGQDPNKTKGAK